MFIIKLMEYDNNKKEENTIFVGTEYTHILVDFR